MNNLPISVLTIVKSRQQALNNLVLGLDRCIHFPAELIIVHMNESVHEITSDNFPVRSFRFDDSEELPLAAARNFAASQTANHYLIFLDVDCIPSPELTLKYYDACQRQENLWIGPVRYLRKGATSENEFFQDMWSLSSADPVRADLKQVSHALFWSLNFACSKSVYDRIGGFDTRFTGYGAEDTDFGFSAREKGIPLGVVDATAFHQYHSSYDPPLNHFEDIIFNAKTFFDKWKRWPMEGWLKKFEGAGLIKLDGNQIKILRKPQPSEINAALKSG